MKHIIWLLVAVLLIALPVSAQNDPVTTLRDLLSEANTLLDSDFKSAQTVILLLSSTVNDKLLAECDALVSLPEILSQAAVSSTAATTKPLLEEAIALLNSCMQAEDASEQQVTDDAGSSAGLIAFDNDDQIWVMEADGSNPRGLTDNDRPILGTTPSWSPDGTQIAFNSNTSGNYNIWVVNADGSDARTLTNNTADDLFGSWSPDGTQLVFTSRRNGGDMEIWVMNVDGKKPRRLTQHEGLDSAPTWSPDGTQIAFVADKADGNKEFDIYIMEADGSNVRRLITSSDGNSSTEPAWSPDGTQIAWVSIRGTYHSGGDIWVSDADGSNSHELTSGSNDFAPQWSPDGTQIVFESKRDGVRNIYVMDSDGNNIRPLTNTIMTNNRNPAWQPITTSSAAP